MPGRVVLKGVLLLDALPQSACSLQETPEKLIVHTMDAQSVILRAVAQIQWIFYYFEKYLVKQQK